MPDALLIARSGLANATQKLDTAARAIAGDTGTRASPPRDGGPITGATGAPYAEMSDPAGAMLDLMTAEIAFRANAEVFKTSADMVRSLYAILD